MNTASIKITNLVLHRSTNSQSKCSGREDSPDCIKGT